MVYGVWFGVQVLEYGGKPSGFRPQGRVKGRVYQPALAATAFCTRPPPTFPPDAAGTHSSFSGPSFVLARARIPRLIIQVNATVKDGLTPL